MGKIIFIMFLIGMFKLAKADTITGKDCFLIQQVVADHITALSEQDYDSAYESLSQGNKETFPKEEFTKFMRENYSDLVGGEVTTLAIPEVSWKGVSDTLKFISQEGEEFLIVCRVEITADGSWKIISMRMLSLNNVKHI